MGKEHTGEDDCFRPPDIPVWVRCLHCGREYESYEIVWVDDASYSGGGYWACPMRGCDGKGFGFDIFPTDCNYEEEHRGWTGFHANEEDADLPCEWEDDWDGEDGDGEEPNGDWPA